MVRQVGCRRGWDHHQSEVEPCHHIEVIYAAENEGKYISCSQQLSELESVYRVLASLDLEDVISSTGCLKPCHFTQYTLPAEPQQITFFNASIVSLVLARATVTLRTEVLRYPLESLVAEFGGALGMFLGFSFIMIWDWLELLLVSALKVKKFITNF